MSAPYKPARRTTPPPGGYSVLCDTALEIASDMQPPGLGLWTWRARRGALEAISFLRDDWFQKLPGHNAYWLGRLRHYRRVHSQVVASWRLQERRAAA